ncbi:uncharacterized protein LOC133205011 [Saccostrea echinata]|uniref:uncharacterized protein LOC133205011 n=1 Tax=Saccostrea echinata TaxID=191078 RepID=UPI002A82B0F8|nr:uncharacterized protein LOC133205011 [Saccostrea echinata]
MCIELIVHDFLDCYWVRSTVKLCKLIASGYNFHTSFYIYLIFHNVCIVFAVLGQELKKTINACISDNVTLFFDLPQRKDLTVGSYLVYKYDVKGDPTFAKVAEKKLETLMDVVEGRLLIDFYDDSSQLKNVVLLNVQKNDVSNYILVINYTNAAKQSPEYVLELPVKDICFENPKEKDGCVFSTCFTGEDGTLMNNETGMTETVNGYKVISNCTSGVTVSYKCCNAAGECEQQMLKVPEPVEDFDNSDSDENGGPSYLTIVGIFGVLIGLALIIGIVVFLMKRRNK